MELAAGLTSPLRGWARVLGLCALLASPGPAVAAEIAIGVAAPLSGPSAVLGAQLRDGAVSAADLYSGADSLTLEVADDACTAEGGAEAARRFAAAKVAVAVGFLCTESIEAALPVLKEAGIPAITVGVRTNGLTDGREKSGWPVFRLAPRADAEQAALADLLIPLWRETLFAVVDDGTIYGRELAESFRAAAEEAGLKPVFVDTYRPQLENQLALAGRLRKAGATHVLMGGDRDDIAILGRDAQAAGMDLGIAGGEALRAGPGPVPLAAGTLMVAPPEWADRADSEVVAAIRVKRIEPEGYVLPAYAAVQIAAQAAVKASGKNLIDVLGSSEFATAIGPVRFDAKGDWDDRLYRLFRYDGTRFVEVD